MNGRRALWLGSALADGGFFFWYTDCAGPLAPDEIESFVQLLEAGGFDDQQVADLRTFMETDTGRQFLMVNALDYAADPPDVEGAPEGASAQTLMDLYMEHMYAEFFARAAHPIAIGDAIGPALDVVGFEGVAFEGTSPGWIGNWSGAALLRQRSRRSFLEVLTHPAMQGRHAFKIAALDKTISYPIEPVLYLGDARWLLGLFLLSTTALVDIAITSRRRRRESADIDPRPRRQPRTTEHP